MKMLTLLIAMMLTGISNPRPLTTCNLGNAKIITNMNDLPKEVKLDFHQRVKNIAASNHPFQKFDDIANKLPSRRFLAAAGYPDRWILVYEDGISYHLHSVGYFKSGGTNPIFQIDVSSNLIGPPCETIKAINAGVRAAFQHHF